MTATFQASRTGDGLSEKLGNISARSGVQFPCKSFHQERQKTMVILAVVGGLFIGGTLFAVLKNSGGSDKKYTKLNIG